MIGLEIEDEKLSLQIYNILCSNGYNCCFGKCASLDLVIVEGKNASYMDKIIDEDIKLILIADDKDDKYINYAYYSLVKPINLNILLSLVNAMDILEANYNEEISRTLLDIGVSASKKGYQYLKDGVSLYINHKDFLVKDIYCQVALHRGTKPQNVERNIRYAIESAFDKCRLDSQEKVFYNSIDPLKGKPTNMELICRIGDLIELNQ